eukprot:1162_1
MAPNTVFLNEKCGDNVYWQTTTFCIEFLLTLTTVLICIYSLGAMKNTHSKQMRFLHWTHILFYISCMVSTILYVNNHFIYCFTENYSFVSDISWMTSIISYVIHWGAVLLALFFRLYYIFQGTTYDISYTFICMFFVLFFSGGAGALVALVYFDYFLENEVLALSSGALLLLLVVIFHVILSIQFVYKLFQVTAATSASHTDITSSKMVIIIRKYTILAVIASIGAVLLLIAFGICIGIGGVNNLFDNILMIVYIFNVFINVICISLSLSLYHKYYVKYCNGLDVLCAKCCGSLRQSYAAHEYTMPGSTSNTPINEDADSYEDEELLSKEDL